MNLVDIHEVSCIFSLKYDRNRFIKMYIFLIVLILISNIFSVFFVVAEGETIVGINPDYKFVSSAETFYLEVYCNPSQLIKSFELEVSFDPLLLEVNSVSEGDIFNGYSTFFNSGNIDNTNGVISNVYGLITGPGMVSDPGSFIDISFTSKINTGISDIGLLNVGVTNNNSYVPIALDDGSVEVDADAPVVTDNSPVTGFTGDIYVFNTSVVDNYDNSDQLVVKVDWSHVSIGDNESMVHVGGSYFEKTINLDSSSISDMDYILYVEDTVGNSYTTITVSVSVYDNDYPLLVADNSDIIGTTGDIYVFDIECSDNVGVSSVNVSWSHGGLSGNKFLSLDGGYWMGSITLDDDLSSLLYVVQVTDSSNNYVRGTQQSITVSDNNPPQISNIQILTSYPLDTSSIYGWVNITCYVTDNEGLEYVFLNVTYPDMSVDYFLMGNSENDQYYYNSSTLFNQPGNYSYYVWVEDISYNTNISDSYDFSMLPNWDIDGNGVCNVLDLNLVSNHYSETSFNGWIREDIDNNGVIQVLDLVLVSTYFGETWW